MKKSRWLETSVLSSLVQEMRDAWAAPDGRTACAWRSIERKATLTRLLVGVAMAGPAAIALAPCHAGAVATDFWVGSAVSPSVWDFPDTTTNWLSSAAPTATTYRDGDNVQFQNQYTYVAPPATAVPNSFTVTVQGTVNPGSVLVNTDTVANPAHEYVFTGSGTIAGAGGLTLSQGALNIANSGGNAYSGGTTVNGGTLLANNAAGSATGTGAVTVNATGTLGGGGSIGGPTTIASGGFLAPSANPAPPPPTTGGAAKLTINNNLVLSSGVGLDYNLNQPNVPGTGGGNDRTTVNNTLSLNRNLSLEINPGGSFGAGTYELLHYGGLTDNSSHFTGWNPTFLNSPASLAPGQFFNLSFSNDAVHDNIDLKVSKSGTPPRLPRGGSTTFIIAPNTPINNSNANNPIAGVNSNNGAGAAAASFFLARGPAPVAKTFSIGWIPVVEQVAPDTPVFAPSGQHVALPPPRGTDIPISPGSPFQTPRFPCAPCGAVPGGAFYPAGTIPVADPPDDWLPAFRLAPLFVVTDPPADPKPTYYAETFSIPKGFHDPNGLGDVFLADQVGGEDFEPGTLDSLHVGDDAQFNFRGSFLSLVQSVDHSITDLSQLTDLSYADFNGSFGVDPANDIAWSVNDIPDASYTVVARSVGVAEPASLVLFGTGLLGFGALARPWRGKPAGGRGSTGA